MTAAHERIIKAMLPGQRHTARDIAVAAEQDYADGAPTKFRKRFDRLAEAGLVRKYTVGNWNLEYALTPAGVAEFRKLTGGEANG